MSPRGALLALCCLVAPGCIAKVPYAPNGGLVEELGEEQAVLEFRDLLTARLQSPAIVAVEVTDKAFIYRYVGAHTFYWGALAVGDATLRILFDTIARVDLYENHKAFMIDGGEQRVGHELLFHTMDDARRFADFIASFKTRPIGGGPAPRPQPPSAPGGEPAPPEGEGAAPR
ncbi:MAG: hypothetical protein AB7N76_23120 [Planctomycetota bacterium]